VKSKLFDEDTR